MDVKLREMEGKLYKVFVSTPLLSYDPEAHK